MKEGLFMQSKRFPVRRVALIGVLSALTFTESLSADGTNLVDGVVLTSASSLALVPSSRTGNASSEARAIMVDIILILQW